MGWGGEGGIGGGKEMMEGEEKVWVVGEGKVVGLRGGRV